MSRSEAIRRVVWMSDAEVRAALKHPDPMLRAAASWRWYPQFEWERMVAAEYAGDFGSGDDVPGTLAPEAIDDTCEAPS